MYPIRLNDGEVLFDSLYRSLYWIGARYDFSLLVQTSIMIVMQLMLLHVALTNRPSQTAVSYLSQPFAGSREGDTHVKRPYNFWQWKSAQPYWTFLAYYAVALVILQIFFGTQGWYVALQGYVALSIEATLPLPQILSNQRKKSCKGFRLSVLVNWLVGDVFKMTFFFLSDSHIPWAFKLCGLFQAACDSYLGIQYCMFGEGQQNGIQLSSREPRLH